MEKLQKLIVAIILLSTLSCSQDILDKEPLSSFSAQGFYKTTSDAQAGVYGIYESLQSNYRINFAYWGEGRADAVETNHSGDPLLLKQNTLNKTMRSAQWTSLYQTISRANYAIKYVPEVSQSEFGFRLIGEARALRALSYFYAVRIWGDVPLITEPYESVEQELFVERTDKELVLDQIVEDLKYAAENCNENFGGERDRVLITQGGANALLTQVYMWRKDYQNASITADLVLDNSLYSLVSMADWSKIFTTGFSNESIFEVGYNDVQTNALRVLYALGSDSDYFPSEKFKNSFEDNDLRQTKIYDTTAAEPRKIWKYFGEGFNDESSDPSSNNIVLIRLADIILLKAEALYELGQTDEALDLVNIIRTRAGLPNLDEASAIAAYGDVQSAILHERSIELSYEGHRWFDLVRTGKAIQVMQPINGLSDEANLVWPLHEDALNRNPNLDQNSFYQ
ncbi:RagB/SusD family nutrient uptake outer membrane protein [Gramella sp. AN32]|uniref:RagB/SusD family nutrient uptake outer membrane protein n=1 Tax=Christiangramia antarctica TaxID=2058158 RepID=A0ABW5X983_9FLAO|nr:RagB/SusD family nutrient uptake outer membrane protein [Gramella sp. AN32]MCM4156012.1 RagB/SusD family nutrient uptake outer membrane protein [Gramella sp. AN32]